MQINQEHNVAVFSLPGEDVFWKVHQVDFKSSAYFDPVIDYFLVRPFRTDQPGIFIEAQVYEPVNILDIQVELRDHVWSNQVTQMQYEEMIQKGIQFSESAHGKVVLSRLASIPYGTIDIGASLQALRTKFPEAFVYLVHTEAYGTWLGATPETLLERYDEDFHTMALAGTRLIDDSFTQKEFDEQYLVAKDIIEQLNDVPVEIGDVHEFPFGEIKHLRTLFQWKSLKPTSEFAERLHPTPAVAGYPRAEAIEAINAIETHDRSLYTGYLGLIQAKGKSQLFVNLRCMQLFDKQIWYYTGGGINAQSDPNKEWHETEQKKNAVMSALVYEE